VLQLRQFVSPFGPLIVRAFHLGVITVP
jgi:hypothetical protein